MSTTAECKECKNLFPSFADQCPHCGRPGLFPNVSAAEKKEEKEALHTRYEKSLEEAKKKGSLANLENFEKATEYAVAVMARPAHELLRLVSDDSEIYATYYQRIERGAYIPKGEKWDKLRQLTDSILFQNQREKIRFAVLSLEGRGLSNYGECFITMRDDMISYRSSVLEENSVMFIMHHSINPNNLDKLLLGYRASWADRSELCVAKLGSRIDTSTQQKDFPYVILNDGTSSDQDEFIEVHIWGSVTIRTVKSISFSSKLDKTLEAIIEAIKQKAIKFGVTIN
ncbi:MAG: hypothetical protein L0Y80_05700 [Ignavibacteriae bacterium]|nr:hypothetical protein [Ignavibacteriota bacterium]